MDLISRGSAGSFWRLANSCPPEYSVVVFAKRRLVCMPIPGLRGAWHASLAGHCHQWRRPSSAAACRPFSGVVDWCGLNSRQINYLQRIASETHYRGSIGQGKTPRQSARQTHFCSAKAQSPDCAAIAFGQNSRACRHRFAAGDAGHGG